MWEVVTSSMGEVVYLRGCQTNVKKLMLIFKICPGEHAPDP